MSWAVTTINAPTRMGKERWVNYHRNNVIPQSTIVLAQESPNGGDTGIKDNQNWFAAAYKPETTSWRQARASGGADGDPIFYKASEWDKIRQGYRVAHGRMFQGLQGAGASATVRQKGVFWVDLRHKQTGKLLRAGNLHAISSNYLNVRDPIHADEMRTLARWIREWPGALVVGGDFNTTWGGNNMGVVRQTGVILANPPGGTHGSGDRQIDLILYRSAKDKDPKIIRESGFRGPVAANDDHRAVTVRFRFQGEQSTNPNPDPDVDEEEPNPTPPPDPTPDEDPEEPCGCGKDC